MSNQFAEDHEQVTVPGFEVPKSPDSSYSNSYAWKEDETRDPPMVPPQLQNTLLEYPPSADTTDSIPLPENVTVNHLYIGSRERPASRSVVALGFTHRFHSKFVTVVLYKPVQRGNTSS